MFRKCVLKLRTVSGLRHCATTPATESAQALESTPEPLTKMEKSDDPLWTLLRINQVMLLGRVGSEPQSRGSEQHPVTVFTLATHTNYRLSTGEMQQKTEWHRISIFKPFLRDSVYKYLSKGQRVMVQGKLTYGQITDAGGVVHTTTSIAADDVIFFNKAVPQSSSSDDDTD